MRMLQVLLMNQLKQMQLVLHSSGGLIVKLAWQHGVDTHLLILK